MRLPIRPCLPKIARAGFLCCDAAATAPEKPRPLYEISADRAHHIVKFRLHGKVALEEMQRFARELDATATTLRGGPLKVLGDLRTFKPAAPEIAAIIGDLQRIGLRMGVTRIAEIVESDVTALHLNRVARESGTEKILRRFWDEESALAWLLADAP